MRVLLCQSYNGPSSANMPLVFPLGLSYIASSIRDEHQVFCWDPNTVVKPFLELSKELEKNKPDVVGISLRNIDSAVSPNQQWCYPWFVQMLKIITQKAPSCKIVVGGTGFSLFANEIMQQNPEIDFGVILEGEHVFPQLLRNFENPERINNLVFRRENKIVFTQFVRYENFEHLPAPSREFFNLEPYKKTEFSFNVLSKKGCVFNCLFCPEGFLSGQRMQLRSPKEVVDEIEELKEEYHVDSFRFADCSFNFPFSHAKKICEELLSRKIKIDWIADFNLAFLDEPFMKIAVESGCKLFSFSPDAASDKALTLLNKNISVKDIKKSAVLAKKVSGTNLSYGFMYDLPNHNSENAIGLVRLVPRLALELGSKLNSISLTKIRIYPHSALYVHALNQGIVSKNLDILFPLYYSPKSKWNLHNIITRTFLKAYYMLESSKRLFKILTFLTLFFICLHW